MWELRRKYASGVKNGEKIYCWKCFHQSNIFVKEKLEITPVLLTFPYTCAGCGTRVFPVFHHIIEDTASGRVEVELKDNGVLLKGEKFTILIADGEVIAKKGEKADKVIETLRCCYFFRYYETHQGAELLLAEEEPFELIEELALSFERDKSDLERFLEKLLKYGRALITTFEAHKIKEGIFAELPEIWKWRER